MWVRSRGLRRAAPGNRARVSDGLLAWRATAGRQACRFRSLPSSENKRWFDSLVQTIGGFNMQEAEAYPDYVRETSGEEEAEKLPMQALDHTAE